MLKAKWKGVLAYEIEESGKTHGLFFGIMFIVYLSILLLSGGDISGGSFSGSAEIFSFVVGIVSVRQDLRLFLQNGKGRRTVFLAQVFLALGNALFMALALPLLGILIQVLASSLFPGNSGVLWGEFSFLYSGVQASLPVMIALAFLANFAVFFLGMCISLIYYRLNKLGKLLVSLGVPALIILLAIQGVRTESLHAVLRFLLDLPSPLAVYAVICIPAAFLCAGASWLLLRRAPVTGSGASSLSLKG